MKIMSVFAACLKKGDKIVISGSTQTDQKIISVQSDLSILKNTVKFLDGNGVVNEFGKNVNLDIITTAII